MASANNLALEDQKEWVWGRGEGRKRQHGSSVASPALRFHFLCSILGRTRETGQKGFVGISAFSASLDNRVGERNKSGYAEDDRPPYGIHNVPRTVESYLTGACLSAARCLPRNRAVSRARNASGRTLASCPAETKSSLTPLAPPPFPPPFPSLGRPASVPSEALVRRSRGCGAAVHLAECWRSGLQGRAASRLHASTLAHHACMLARVHVASLPSPAPYPPYLPPRIPIRRRPASLPSPVQAASTGMLDGPGSP